MADGGDGAAVVAPEHQFLQAILEAVGAVEARIIETPRNYPVRNLYRDNGFTFHPDGLWAWAPVRAVAGQPA